MTKVTTKKCPVCGNKDLALLTSTNEKVCVNHIPLLYIKWTLDIGQVGVYSNNRIKNKQEILDVQPKY